MLEERILPLDHVYAHFPHWVLEVEEEQRTRWALWRRLARPARRPLRRSLLFAVAVGVAIVVIVVSIVVVVDVIVGGAHGCGAQCGLPSGRQRLTARRRVIVHLCADNNCNRKQ